MINTTCELGFQLKTRVTIHLTHYGISLQESQYCISGSLKRNLTEENEAPSNTHTTHAKCIFKRFLAFSDDLWLLTFNHFFFSLSLLSYIFAENEKLVLDIVLQIRAL